MHILVGFIINHTPVSSTGTCTLYSSVHNTSHTFYAPLQYNVLVLQCSVQEKNLIICMLRYQGTLYETLESHMRHGKYFLPAFSL